MDGGLFVHESWHDVTPNIRRRILLAVVRDVLVLLALAPSPVLAELIVRTVEPELALTGEPVSITYRLEDAEGNLLSALSGIRLVVTVDESAVFGATERKQHRCGWSRPAPRYTLRRKRMSWPT